MEPQEEIYLNSGEFKNPDLDVEIKNFFTSTQLDRKCLRIALNGEIFNILLIHNPENVKLTSKVDYNTSKHGPLSFVASCNKKVCIFVDKKAPRALIKHISSFHNLSWWGRCRNLVISNGSKIQHQFTEKKRFTTSYTIYTYTTPCSWYEAMKKATS